MRSGDVGRRKTTSLVSPRRKLVFDGDCGLVKRHHLALFSSPVGLNSDQLSCLREIIHGAMDLGARCWISYFGPVVVFSAMSASLALMQCLGVSLTQEMLSGADTTASEIDTISAL